MQGKKVPILRTGSQDEYDECEEAVEKPDGKEPDTSFGAKFERAKSAMMDKFSSFHFGRKPQPETIPVVEESPKHAEKM